LQTGDLPRNSRISGALTRGGGHASIGLLRKRYCKRGHTIRDVARLAGVSPGTVSKALNGTDRVGADTRERVRAVAKQLNWQPNQLARGLVLRRTHLIGLVVPSITNDFCAQVYEGAQSYASERGYSLLLSVTEDDPQREASVVKRFTEAVHVDGIIAIPAPIEEGKSPFRDLHAAHWPYVLVSRRFPGLPSDYVICDNLEGGRLATEHLISLGHRRIAYVFDSRQSACTNVIERRQGYQRALAAAGIDCDPALCVAVDLHNHPQNQVQLRNMIDARRPTAIFAHNDRTAVIVLGWLRSVGLGVPSDMALVGFANLNLATIVTPTLTTVEYGLRETGRLAAKALIDRVEGKTAEPQQIVLTPRLIVRESSGGRLCQS